MFDEADIKAMNEAIAARQAAARRRLPECADDAATVCVGSDRYPVSIIARDGASNGGHVLTVQYDEERIVGGSEQNGSAEYEYYANPNGPIAFYRFNPNKDCYEQVVRNEQSGRFNKVGSRGFYVGRREYYRDPHF